MGKALYREYRPKRLDDVVGQEHITTTLKNALKKGAISHAYLFTGPRGVGKTSVARILAHEINGLDYTDESIHLDIIEIDAASNRRIDEIRELRDKVHTAPTSAKYKVYIIDEVHMLTREAFNALLKTLEEPPEHAIFILATTEAHKVPDTIISRTQRFTFKPINQKETVNHLKAIARLEKMKVSEDALVLLANHGRGSFRDSISMLDQLAGLNKDNLLLEDVHLLLGVPSQELIDQLVKAIETGQIADIFSLVQTLREQGVDSGRAASSISENIRNKLIVGELAMDYDTTLRLLKDLLPLTLSSNDFLGLELALLSTFSPELKTTGQVPSKPPKPAGDKQKIDQADSPKLKEPAAGKQSMPEKVEKTKLPTPTKKPRIFSSEAWTELLNDLKTKHNTLYGVLRMAEPHHDGESIALKFKFGFHKKQIDAPRNTALLRDYLKTYFGEPDFITETGSVTEKPAQSTPHPQKPANSEAVTSVSNIFGGAELLE